MRKIQYVLCPEGEYKIPNVGKVDGYCEEINTIYEFHDNPNVYNSDDINERVHKTFGELYRKSVEKDSKILSLGYNLVVKWETDFPEYTQACQINTTRTLV